MGDDRGLLFLVDMWCQFFFGLIFFPMRWQVIGDVRRRGVKSGVVRGEEKKEEERAGEEGKKDDEENGGGF